MNTIRSAGAFAALALLFLTVPAQAQLPSRPSITVGGKVTTLGYGPEAGIGFGRLNFRAGLNVLSLGRDFDFSDIDYGVNLRFRTITALADIYLLGPIRLSGGMVVNNNKLELSADPTVSVDLGGVTYQASDVGTISATIDYAKKTAPYLGIGLGGRGRIGFVLEAGFMFTGSPRLTYSATTTLTGPAATTFQNQVDAEATQVQADIDDTRILKTYPVAGFGIQVRF